MLARIITLVESPRGTAPRGAPGTGRDTLASPGSDHRTFRSVYSTVQCTNSVGSRVRIRRNHSCARRQLLRNRLYFRFERFCRGHPILPQRGCHGRLDPMMHSLRSTAITAASSLLRGTPPLRLASVLWISGFMPLDRLPSHRDNRFPCSIPEPGNTVTPPLHRMPPGRSSGFRRTPPGPLTEPRFRHHL